MKRIFLALLSTALIALLGLPTAAAATTRPTLSLIGMDELLEVTAGRCLTKCDDDEEEEEEEEPEPYRIGFEWLQSRQVDKAAQQLSYAIVAERSNVYGTSKVSYSYTFSDNCRYQWTSGGVGISTGLNVSVGRTYYCSQSVKVAGSLNPGYRVKIYRGDMRQVHLVTVSQYEVFSDGSSEPTGHSDTGRRVNNWARYSDVIAR